MDSTNKEDIMCSINIILNNRLVLMLATKRTFTFCYPLVVGANSLFDNPLVFGSQTEGIPPLVFGVEFGTREKRGVEGGG